jgi:DNA-binding CsgD family transcriptional regulator
VEPETQPPAEVDAPAVVRVAREFADARSLDDLERVFSARFGRVIDVPMYGFYALDEDRRGIDRNVGVNVSDAFVARYERAMHLDPLLEQARATGSATYNLAAMSPEEWEESAIYRLAYATHAMRHVAEVPIKAAGDVVGALHFAASEPTRGFVAANLRMADALSEALGAAIAEIRSEGRADRELRQLRAAMDLAGVSVAVSHPGACELRLNAGARRLLEQVVNWEERLHHLLRQPAGARRFTRRVEVALGSGSHGTLLAHCERLDGGELVAVIELQRARPHLSQQILGALTPREADVAALIVEGLTDREIAVELSISHHTVGQHAKGIYRKTGVDSRVALTRQLTYHSDG